MHTPSKTPKSILSHLDRISYELHGELPQIARLKPGEKNMFIRHHHETILDFCDLFGDNATLKQFNLRIDTLDRIKGTAPVREYKKVSHAEAPESKADTALRALETLERKVSYLEVEVTAIANMRREIAELKELYNEFTEVTASKISKALLIPLLASLMKQFKGKLPEVRDLLAIESLPQH